MTEILYRLLLLLHPPAFRKRFAEEMLWAFQQDPEHAWRNIADAAGSAIRRWATLPTLWATLIGTVCACAIFAFCLRAVTIPNTSSLIKADPLFIVMISAAVFPVAAAMIFSASLFQWVRRRRG